MSTNYIPILIYGFSMSNFEDAVRFLQNSKIMNSDEARLSLYCNEIRINSKIEIEHFVDIEDYGYLGIRIYTENMRETDYLKNARMEFDGIFPNKGSFINFVWSY